MGLDLAGQQQTASVSTPINSGVKTMLDTDTPKPTSGSSLSPTIKYDEQSDQYYSTSNPDIQFQTDTEAYKYERSLQTPPPTPVLRSTLPTSPFGEKTTFVTLAPELKPVPTLTPTLPVHK